MTDPVEAVSQLTLELTDELRAIGFAFRNSTMGELTMGNASAQLATRSTEFLILSDRGESAAAAESIGSPSYKLSVWAVFFDVDISEVSGFVDEVHALISILPRINDAIENDPDIVEKLRDINWRFVKDYLGLDPDVPRFKR